LWHNLLYIYNSIISSNDDNWVFSMHLLLGRQYMGSVAVYTKVEN